MTATWSISRTGAIIFAIVVVMFSGINGQAPAPATNCNDALLNLASCLTYVTNSSVTSPDSGCCPALQSLYDKTPVCLCELLGMSGETFGITINRTRALMLPGVCHVAGADPNLCALLGVPVPGPIPSEVPVPGPIPSEVPGPGPNPSEAPGSISGGGSSPSGPETASSAAGAPGAPPPEKSNGDQRIRFSSLVFIAGLLAMGFF